jgi:phytoene synthase
MSMEQAGYQNCWEILREHGKTFHVMARVMGETRGSGIAAIYGFARTADDTVDVPGAETRPEEIQRQLAHMRSELRRGVDSVSDEPRFDVLGETVRRYGIELYPFDDLLDGVAMDLSKSRYEDYKELELYCYRVAGTIGLMITPVAGFVPGSKALEYAKTLGTAFQLTNILRDVGEDLRRGRIYLPKEDLARFGITEADLRSHRRDAAFRAMMDFQIERAFSLYREGLALIPLVTTWSGRLAFQFACDAYSAIMHKIRENDYDVYTKRAHLTLWEKLMMIPGCWWRAHKAWRSSNG